MSMQAITIAHAQVQRQQLAGYRLAYAEREESIVAVAGYRLQTAHFAASAASIALTTSASVGSVPGSMR